MLAITVQDPSQVAGARRAAAENAERLGFPESDAGRVALVATELATNLVKHGRGGEILIGAYEEGDGPGVELLALDRGPGIPNLNRAIEDGYSNAGTAGNGLGAVVRQSSFVDVASWPGVGTAILARLAPGRSRLETPNGKAGWGAVSVPKPGENVCGDSWSVRDGGGTCTLLVADGLGHGPEAAEAAVEAVRLFHRFSGHQVPTLLDYVHGGLRATRGAAVAIARIEPASRKIIYAGIGNVSGAIAAHGQLRRMVSMAGTAGHNARKIQAFDYPFDSGLIIMHSDGLVSNWSLDRYPALFAYHPTLIAGVLYRDLARRSDDATVLVGKW